MALAKDQETIRVALIGPTGGGKSAVGNTLLGFKRFKSIPAGESVTNESEEGIGQLPSGQKIRVVDTPGIFHTEKQDVASEITKCIAYLSPGPHAFIIVLSPSMRPKEGNRLLSELTDIFGDETFLKHSLIVMTRRIDIRNEDDNLLCIHEHIEKMSEDCYIKILYTQCDERLVAVENLESKSEKQRYAMEIANEISTINGYYSYDYFRFIMQLKEDKYNDAQKVLKEKTKKESTRSICLSQ